MVATTRAVGAQRLFLHGIRWETYEALLTDYEQRSAPRFAYDRGELEIMSPSPDHEVLKNALARVIEIVLEERERRYHALGSTTFRWRERLQGFEPDACYYVRNTDAIRGLDRIDIPNDPAPDLVVEIDISRSSLPKRAMYAAFGVSEYWRHDGQRVTIFVRDGDDFVERSESDIIPGLTTEIIDEFVRLDDELEKWEWRRKVQAWARANPAG